MTHIACKVCGTTSPWFATVDFSKHCNERAIPLPRAGIPVPYYRCPACDFIFTDFLDTFSDKDLSEQVYNEDYIKVDPLYPELRPSANAAFLQAVLTGCFTEGADLEILDYGAGSGRFAALLRERAGAKVTCYDALNPAFDRLPRARFDVIFCSEVVEHVPVPRTFVAHWQALLRDGGVVLFSTATPPPDIDTLKASWWYISPRNGHVSIYSAKTLSRLFADSGLRYRPLSTEWHLLQHAAPAHGFDEGKLQALVDKLPTGFIDL